MNKKLIIAIIVTLAALILTFFNIRSIINVGIKKSGVTEAIPTVMRKSYLDALVALTEDYSIYDHFSVIERTTDQEVLKEYSNANKYDLVIYDGKDSKNLIKKLAKDEAFLYLSIEMFQKKEDTVNEYSVLYYVRNAELNNIQDLYSSVTKLSYKEQVKYAKDYALNEYNAVGYSLKLHKIKFILMHVLYEILYIFFTVVAILKIKK